MAQPWFRFFPSLLLLIVIITFQLYDLVLCIKPTTMILPLYHSSSSSAAHFSSRRHLLSTRRSSARMALHDDLLINGYYTTRLWIGTPPQMFALIVDSGSTVTYVPCSTCKLCGRHQDPRFQPDKSVTYHPVKCNVDCTCDSANENCIYERQYAEMSSSSGVLGEDIVSFGNLSELVPQRALFGCENMETGDLYSQHADGIMGLGRGELSIVDQLVDKKVINNSFSLCYGGMDIGGGAMVLGELSSPTGMVFANSNPNRSPYYNIELKGLNVAGKELPLNPGVFDGKHGTVLDSGTTYAYLPESAFLAFKNAMMKELHSLKLIRGPDPNYNDICFSGAASDVSELSKSFPAVDMVFSDGQKLTLSPENYLFRHSKEHGAYCLGIFQNGKDPTTLLGGIVVRNTLVTYDREHNKIGFWKTNCSELWQRLQLPGAGPPMDGGSVKLNSTAGISPSLSPSGPTKINTHGETNIGLLTFSMSLSINYTDLEPIIPELSEAIAKELGVNASQVQYVNSTSYINGTLLKWAVFPVGSAHFMSNATAMEIIGQLAEQQIHLPGKFGSYKLVEWNTEPPQKQTWWQRHYVIVVASFLGILILGFSTYGAWYVRQWQNQESLIPYKPVDSAVPDQELQPVDSAVPEQELQPLKNRDLEDDSSLLGRA